MILLPFWVNRIRIYGHRQLCPRQRHGDRLYAASRGIIDVSEIFFDAPEDLCHEKAPPVVPNGRG